jgi:hypothetical protein
MAQSSSLAGWIIFSSRSPKIFFILTLDRLAKDRLRSEEKNDIGIFGKNVFDTVISGAAQISLKFNLLNPGLRYFLLLKFISTIMLKWDKKAQYA